MLLILNGLIVTMSETFQIFANDYNRQFMVNPIIETIYYLATFGIALKLVTELFEEKNKNLSIWYLYCFCFMAYCCSFYGKFSAKGLALLFSKPTTNGLFWNLFINP